MQKDKIWFNSIEFNSQPKLQKSDFGILEQVLYESLKSKNFNPQGRVIKDYTPRILFLSVAPNTIFLQQNLKTTITISFLGFFVVLQ